jgi:ubiquinone/menaquinone biosynthesis C-methylase UbiE
MSQTPFNEAYFSTNTYQNVSFGKYSQYWWSNRFYATLARRYGLSGTRLLETGCGLGHLVGQLEDTFTTLAIDVNHWAVKQAKPVATRTGLNTASAERLPFADESIGVLISKHVVEHLPHPEESIAEMGRVLQPGGILILATPNLDSILKPLKGNKWIGYQDPTHISLKKPAEWLRYVGEDAKLDVLKVFSDGCWDAPYIPVIPKSIQKIVFGSLGGIQAITTWIFIPRTWGESIIIIARKPIGKFN